MPGCIEDRQVGLVASLIQLSREILIPDPARTLCTLAAEVVVAGVDRSSGAMTAAEAVAVAEAGDICCQLRFSAAAAAVVLRIRPAGPAWSATWRGRGGVK